MSYVYETHLHTVEASACGKSPGSEYVRRYQDLGYEGIIVTDHFFRGNSGVPRALPWRERIHWFCSGYENAREAGEKAGFSVFFGWEENYNGDEYLIYGLDKQFMLEHPEMEFWTRREQFDAVHKAGGCVVQAHPFRDRDYIAAIHLSPACVDAVEACNAANTPENDALATRYATVLGLPMTAGSDIHQVNHWPDAQMMGVVFDKPLASIHDYVRAILEKRPFGLKTPPERGQWREDIAIRLPVDILDCRGKSSGEDVRKLLELD